MNKYYYLDGSVLGYYDEYRTLHRLDGPAVEYKNGAKSWYQNGKLHRLGGPSIEYISGSKSWYQNGLRHRIDGPAIEFYDGEKIWYINDKRLTKEEFEKHILIMQLSGLLDG